MVLDETIWTHLYSYTSRNTLTYTNTDMWFQNRWEAGIFYFSTSLFHIYSESKKVVVQFDLNKQVLRTRLNCNASLAILKLIILKGLTLVKMLSPLNFTREKKNTYINKMIKLWVKNGVSGALFSIVAKHTRVNKIENNKYNK